MKKKYIVEEVDTFDWNDVIVGIIFFIVIALGSLH